MWVSWDGIERHSAGPGVEGLLNIVLNRMERMIRRGLGSKADKIITKIGYSQLAIDNTAGVEVENALFLSAGKIEDTWDGDHCGLEGQISDC